MANPRDDGTGAPPSHIHIDGEKKTNWFPWILAALALLALIFALTQCGDSNQTVAVAPAPVVVNEVQKVEEVAPIAIPVAAPAGISGLGAYLAGTGALPQTFVFERMYFDTAQSTMRADSRDEVADVSTALKRFPNARVRVVGFADARGPSDANAALGLARANSAKAALVANGIAAARIETASGGEANPAETNATASGQAENRRTEFVALTR